MWSMNLDLDSMGAPTTVTNNMNAAPGANANANAGAGASSSTQEQTPATSVTSGNPGQVFMGATTPGTGM